MSCQGRMIRGPAEKQCSLRTVFIECLSREAVSNRCTRSLHGARLAFFLPLSCSPASSALISCVLVRRQKTSQAWTLPVFSPVQLAICLTTLFSFSVFSLSFPFFFFCKEIFYGDYSSTTQTYKERTARTCPVRLPRQVIVSDDRGTYECFFTVGLLGRVHELLLLSLPVALLRVSLLMVLHLVVRGPFLL
jgi:hypothetical protein